MYVLIHKTEKLLGFVVESYFEIICEHTSFHCTQRQLIVRFITCTACWPVYPSAIQMPANNNHIIAH